MKQISPIDRDTTSFDVIIVGGGPAGCTVALSLLKYSRKARCLLIDDANPALFKIGESLPPESSRLLHHIHPSLPTQLNKDIEAGIHCICTGNASSWASSYLEERHSTMNPFGHGLHLNRSEFDEMLRKTINKVSNIDKRVNTIKGRCHLVKKGANNKWTVDAETDGIRRTFHAHWVIDATGRKATVATKIGAKIISPPCGRLLAFYALLSSRSALSSSTAEGDNDNRTLIEATPDGWFYSSLLSRDPCSRIVVFHTLPTHQAAKRAKQKAGFMELLQQSSTVIWNIIDTCDYQMDLSYPRCTAGGSSHLNRICDEKEQWIAVGDAAMAFDPLSSQGIMTALETGFYIGAVLAKRMENGDENCSIESEIEETFRLIREEYHNRRKYYYGIVGRFKEEEFWKNVAKNVE